MNTHLYRAIGAASLSLVAAFALVVSAYQPAPPPKRAQDVDYAAELPRIPAKTIEGSLQAIKVKSGFHVELVASEPLIRSPMAMDFDEYGRAYVVELPEYNQYGSAKPHGTGAIKRLEDTDGDGRYDKATVFVDKLSYPTAVACWKGGVLVGVAPDILYCQDLDGDGEAETRRKLFTGFGQDKAGEGMLNSFRWRIDNRFHIPTGLDGGEIVPVTSSTEKPSPDSAKPLAQATPAKPLNARGQHLLLDPRTMTLVATSGGGQHGMSLDDWNQRAFVCGNSEPAHLVMYDGRYLARNPYLEALAAAINIAPAGKNTKLMRISPVEPWRVLRTRLRSQGVIPGSDEGGQPSGFFTGATGITVYRGDAWPAEYRGQLFVGEVANNLVFRARLVPAGLGLTAERADADAEFLASSDNWFRPVQFANAPDGTLYVLDMHRELIEGAAFLAPQILKHMDVAAGVETGRIYRIAPDGFQHRPAPRLGDLPAGSLVALYEHANAWHRDTASRLIYERQDQGAVPPLRDLAARSKSPLARIMALYSLHGLAALDAPLVAKVLADNAMEAEAREHALRLAESFANDAAVRELMLAAVRDPSARVRYQTAFSLGAFSGEAVTRALAELTVRDGADTWMQLAIQSSLAERQGEFLATLLPDAEACRVPHVRVVLTAVAGQIASANAKDALAVLVRELDGLATRDAPLANELVKKVLSKRPEARELLAGATSGRAKELVAAIVREAVATARDPQKPIDERAAAARTLGAADFDEVKEVFAELLQSRQPQPVQAAVLETLARFKHAGVPALVLSAWSSQTPQLRATSVETLFTRAAWINELLDAVEKETIPRADLDPARVALLQKHGDATLRERAAKLFAGTSLPQRQKVVDAYQKALELRGDVDRGRQHFRKTCAACHQLEGTGTSLGADLKAIRDRGLAAVMLNILDPNREVKPQFLNYVLLLNSGRSVTGLIAAETANSLTIRKADGMQETVLRVDIDELKSSGISFMPEGLEKQLDVAAMADLLAYLNSIK